MKYKYLITVIMILISLNFISAWSSNTLQKSNFTGICYQETANASNIADGSCGLNYSGSYGGRFSEAEALIDGDWIVNAPTVAPEGYINYSIPWGVSNILWRIRDVTSENNLTVTSSCFLEKSIIELKIVSDAVTSSYYCKNSSDWQLLLSRAVFHGYTYEEAVIWNITSITSENLTFFKSDNINLSGTSTSGFYSGGMCQSFQTGYNHINSIGFKVSDLFGPSNWNFTLYETTSNQEYANFSAPIGSGLVSVSTANTYLVNINRDIDVNKKYALCIMDANNPVIYYSNSNNYNYGNFSYYDGGWTTTNGDLSFYISGTNTNTIRYLTIPSNTILTNAYLNLSGFDNLNNIVAKDRFDDSSLNVTQWTNHTYVGELLLTNSFTETTFFNMTISTGFTGSGAQISSRSYLMNNRDLSDVSISKQYRINFNWTDYASVGGTREDTLIVITNSTTDAIVNTDCYINNNAISLYHSIGQSVDRIIIRGNWSIYINSSNWAEVYNYTGQLLNSVDLSSLNGSHYINFVTCSRAGTGAIYLYNFSITELNNFTGTNKSLSIGNNQVWNYSRQFNQSNNKTNNLASYINSYLSSCSYIAGFCYVPFNFHSDSPGILNYNDLIFNNIGFIENSQTYNTISYESANEQFKINLTYDYNNYGLSGNIIYNNVSYTGLISGSNENKIITSNLTIPNINGSIPFYWNITLTNLSGYNFYYSSNNYTQTVNKIYFEICNYTSPINVTILNFTTIDESNSNLVNSWFKGTFYYANKNYSYQDLTQTSNNYSFCSNLNVNLSVSADIQYGASGFLDRTYYLYNENLNNLTTLINLPLLNSSLGTPFYFNVRQGTNIVSEALVYIEKYYTGLGNYTTISIRKTDSDGKFQEYLELNQKYRFTIKKDGITLGTIEKQSICSASPCTIDLNVEENILNPFDPFYNYFAQNIVYTLDYDLNQSKIYLNFTDNTGTAQYWRLYVYQGNSSSDNLITICDLKYYSATGSLTCDFTGYYGDIGAKVYISRSPEKLVDFLNFVNSNASTILGESGILASIIILLVIIFTGTRNPAIAIMMIPFGFLILKFIGFLPLGWTWIVAIFIFCLWISAKLKT